MSRIPPCSRVTARRKPKIPGRWKQWCVDDELGMTHAVNEHGDSFEYVVLTQGMGIRFRPGMKIRHRDGNSLNNRRCNLAIELVEAVAKDTDPQ